MVRPRLVSDEVVLEAARLAFMKHGNRATTAAIAEAAGLSEAGLLKRFETKEKLLVQAMTQFLGSRPSFPSIPAAPVSRAVLVEFAGQILRFFRDIVPASVMMHSHLAAVGAASAFGNGEPLPLMFRRRVYEYFQSAAKRGEIAIEEPQVLASALTGTLWQAAFFEYMLDDRELLGDGETTFLERVVDLLWQGIDPNTQSRRRTVAPKPTERRSVQTPPKRSKPGKKL